MTDGLEGPPDVRMLTEEELADWLLEKGRPVVFSQGRFWLHKWGFFRRLHFAATMPADLLGRPGRTCLAYHTLLPDGDAPHANAWSPLHLVRDLAEFDEGQLHARERKHLRRCRATLQLIRLRDPELLRAQGWAVFSQNARRLQRNGDVDEDRYLAGVERITDSRGLVLGAMDGNRLLGYLETYAVDGTAYLSDIRLSDEAMRHHVSGFLHFEASQLYRRSGLVSQVCPGPPLPERPGVSEFKRRWGMPLVPMPARFWSPAPLRSMLKAGRPATYYRATGQPARGVPPEILRA